MEQLSRKEQIEEIRRVHGDEVAREYMTPAEIAAENTLQDKNPGDVFQHTITGRVCKDKAGKEFIKFSTYLSFLQISFRVYLPGLMRDTVKVYASFHLKRPGENRDGTPRNTKR